MRRVSSPLEELVWLAMALIGILSAIFLFDKHLMKSRESQLQDAFQAWIKQTGNEKHLTYEEWRSLVRAIDSQNKTQFIFVPH